MFENPSEGSFEGDNEPESIADRLAGSTNPDEWSVVCPFGCRVSDCEMGSSHADAPVGG